MRSFSKIVAGKALGVIYTYTWTDLKRNCYSNTLQWERRTFCRKRLKENHPKPTNLNMILTWITCIKIEFPIEITKNPLFAVSYLKV